MKRLLSFVFTLCAMFVLTCMAVGIMSNVQPSVAQAETTKKFEVVGGTEVNGVLTFEYGAPIKVTPYGTGTDWIGIAPKGKVSKGGIRWAYIAEGEGNATKYSPAVVGAGSGVTIDIRYAFASDAHMASNANTNDTTTGTADITPGEWTIFWVASNGSAGKYDTASAVDIVVTDGPMSLEKATFYVGDEINVTTNGTTSQWYGIVPDDGNGIPKRSYGTIMWAYCEGSEVTRNLRTIVSDINNTKKAAYFNNTNATACASFLGVTVPAVKMLPAGKYWIVFFAGSGNVGTGSWTHSVQINIKPVISVAKKTFNYGEEIGVTQHIANTDSYAFITKKDESDSVINYSIRYQRLTNTVGTVLDLRKGTTSGNFKELQDIPAGDYTIFYVNGYSNPATKADHASRIDITVIGGKPESPSSVTYTLDDKTTGLAGGDIVVSFPQTAIDDTAYAPSHVILYWGDENGKLSDQTYICVRPVTGATTTISLASVTAIPQNATRLMVYAYNAIGVSDGFVSADLPADRTKTTEKGKLLSSFQIISDTHVQESNEHAYNVNMQKMLEDIKLINPESVGIFLAGDAVNDGRVEEYENFYSMWETSALAPIYMAPGNHEYKMGDVANSYTTEYEVERDRFLFYANKLLQKGGYDMVEGKPYYDLWVNGFHYIFLGSEYAGTNAYLSDTQLAWLDNTLNSRRNENRPTFIFLHQSMYNTVAGGMPNQTWNGVIAGDENWEKWKSATTNVNNRNMLDKYEDPLRNILRKYPEAMMFNGHSHWDLTSANNVYEPTAPTDTDNAVPNYIFNTASVGYLASDVRKVGSENIAGSKGYYVNVYENCIEFLGRDFMNAKWVPNATYRIALDLDGYCGHVDISDVKAKDKTCLEDGNIAHLHCNDCGVNLNEMYEILDNVIIKAGHELENVIAKDKTCTEDGYTAHKACKDCDYVEGKEVIPAGHEYFLVSEVPSTKTETGVKEHYICLDCEDLFLLVDGEYVKVTADDLVIKKLSSKNTGCAGRAMEILGLIVTLCAFAFVIKKIK